METNSHPSIPGMPMPHHLYRATSEGAGSQYQPNSHFSNPLLCSQPLVNFTELPLQSYQRSGLVDPLAGQCQQQNWALPTFLELPLNQRDLSDNKNINALSPRSLYDKSYDHRMKLSIRYHGNRLADDRKYTTLVDAKVKPRGILTSDNKAETSGNAVRCSSRISGEYPCLRCSQADTNFKPSISWMNQREGYNLSSSSNFRAQHVQSYLASESDSDSIAGCLVSTKPSPTNVSEINRRQWHEDPQAHSERSQALKPRDRPQNEYYMPQIVPITSASEYQPQPPPLVSNHGQHRNVKPLPYQTRPPGPQTSTNIEGTTHPHEQLLGTTNTTNEGNPCSVDQSRISDHTPCPIIDINPTHFGPQADLNGFPFYIEWQQFSFVDGIWKWYPEHIALVELTGQKLHPKSVGIHGLLEQPCVAKCLTENPTVGWPRVIFQNNVSCVVFSITGATIGLDNTPVTLEANFSQFIPDILPNLNPFSSTTLGAAYRTESLAISDPNTAAPMEGRKRGSELLSKAKEEHVIVVEQAILALLREVRSRTRLSSPSPRTLKELYQAGFNGLNANTCRDLLYKWVAIMRNAKESRYMERPSWWPEYVRYTSVGELYGPEVKAVLFHLFYGEYGRVPLREFYAAGRGIRMKDIDQKTLSWAFCIRRVFKTDIMLRLPEDTAVMSVGLYDAGDQE